VIADKDELSAWRGHPVTDRLRKLMEGRINAYLREVPQYLMRGKSDEAKAAAHALDAYQELFDDLFTDATEKVAEREQDDYRDPAARPARKET